MSSVQEQNELVVKRLFMECFSGGQLDVLDDIIADDFLFEYPNLPAGIEGLRTIVQKNNESFEGWQFTIHDMFSADNRVCARWSSSGKHVSSFLGEPVTGKIIHLKGISIYWLRDGKIYRDFVEPDNLAFMTELGLFAPVDFSSGQS